MCLFYLDDGTLGGSVETLRHDLEVIYKVGETTGLELNRQKSEIICSNSDIEKSTLLLLPGAELVDPLKATLYWGEHWGTGSYTYISAHSAILLLS